MMSGWVQTVKGAVAVEDLGLILPHEHLFTDLRGPLAPDYARAESEAVARVVDYTLALLEAGCAENILLSHDAGWYDPSQPDGQPEGSGIRGYTALLEKFIPALRARGVTNDLVHLVTVTNSARAFAFAGNH
jgi:predicted metal-dependent phosphotriesterase family hydrolase